MLCEPVTWELAAPGSFPGCLESEPQVPGLQPHTQYQFSVLAQNKLGSGPFSEIVLSAPEGE